MPKSPKDPTFNLPYTTGPGIGYSALLDKFRAMTSAPSGSEPEPTMDTYTESTKCPKCRSADYELQYAKRAGVSYGSFFEFLQATCKRCGYAWEMLPADHVEKGRSDGEL